MRLLSANAALILSAFLADSGRDRYGYELMQATGIKSGSLYPVLGRFEELGWIKGRIEESDGHRPARRVYAFEPSARDEAEQALNRYLETKVAPAERVGWGLA